VVRVRPGSQTRRLLAFVLPTLAFYVAFVLIPVVVGVWYSLTNWNLLNPTPRFVGLENYVTALTEDAYFIDSVLFALKYVAFMVLLQNVLALGLAVIAEGLQRGWVFFRSVLFMPNMIDMIIGGFMWLFVFTIPKALRPFFRHARPAAASRTDILPGRRLLPRPAQPSTTNEGGLRTGLCLTSSGYAMAGHAVPGVVTINCRRLIRKGCHFQRLSNPPAHGDLFIVPPLAEVV